MADTFHVQVLKPDGLVLEAEAVDAVIPGVLGYFGVRKGHAPLLTMLGVGEVTIKGPAGEQHVAVIADGFCEVGPERVVVLAETAERSDEVDVARAERAKARAEEIIRNPTASAEELEKAHGALERAETRIKVAQAGREARRH